MDPLTELPPDVVGYMNWLKRQVEELIEERDQVRAAWNAHMARCGLPAIPGMTDEELFAKLGEWRNAPSDTASASPNPSPTSTKAAPQPPKKAPDSPTGSSERLRPYSSDETHALLAQVEQLRLRNQELTQERDEARESLEPNIRGWQDCRRKFTALRLRNQTMREALERIVAGNKDGRYWPEEIARAALSEPAEPERHTDSN